jgi:hypothetical protein
MSLPVPIAMDGKAYRVHAVEFCYDVQDPGNEIVNVSANVIRETDGDDAQTISNANDSENRSDNACRPLVFATPFTMTRSDRLTMHVQVTWATAGTEFTLGRVTVWMSPTATAAPPIPVAP